MKKVFSRLSVAALMAVMLTACANKNDAEKASETANTQTEATAAPEQVTEAPTQAAEAPAQEQPAFPRTYTDAASREVVIEKEPFKVAISYLPHWETLIMLGISPVGTTHAEKYAAEWDALQGIDLGDVVDLGDTEVNLELLAQLEPDIILEQTYDISNVNVENLEKIAPVAVFGDQVKMDWRYSLREIGKVVGREQKAEEVIAEVDQKLADARGKLQEKYDGKTVMLMSVMGEDRYFCAYRPDLYDKESGLGLNVPAGFPAEQTYVQVSMEALVEMNPDYLFVNVFDGDEALLEGLNENSVWQSLNAVKAGHVYRLDGTGHAASALSTVYTVDFIINTLLENEN